MKRDFFPSKTHLFLLLSMLVPAVLSAGKKDAHPAENQTIFVFGGDINSKFVRYAAQLTGKDNPKICYLPTASADNEKNIKYWNTICSRMPVEAHVMRVWGDDKSMTHTFEDILLSMDAIVVGGGNTLNMLGIWKAQGIDTVLRKALGKGIVLAGGSAGSICWFDSGVSDSRPVRLSVVEGLGLLPASHCPHYGDSLKKQTYHNLVQNGTVKPGYACDELAGIVFRGGRAEKFVSFNELNNSYFVRPGKKGVKAEKLKSEFLVSPEALPEGSYIRLNVGKTASDFPENYDLSSPLNASVAIAYLFSSGRFSRYPQFASRTLTPRLGEMKDRPADPSHLNNTIDRVLVYRDKLAGIVKKHKDFYAIQYFYLENGKWMCAGEDMGGDTAAEAEISFREKAAVMMEKATSR